MNEIYCCCITAAEEGRINSYLTLAFNPCTSEMLDLEFVLSTRVFSLIFLFSFVPTAFPTTTSLAPLRRRRQQPHSSAPLFIAQTFLHLWIGKTGKRERESVCLCVCRWWWRRKRMPRVCQNKVCDCLNSSEQDLRRPPLLLHGFKLDLCSHLGTLLILLLLLVLLGLIAMRVCRRRRRRRHRC